MNEYILRAEDVLHSIAETYTPEGSKPKAVIHQWLNAIAYNKSLFAESLGVKKSDIVSILKKNRLYTNKDDLKASIHHHLSLKSVKNPKFTFIDLFAGIGGMRLGFQQNEGLCVFSSEFDFKAQQTYEMNHGDFPFGDITKITGVDPHLIPQHDVLLAGFPCQPFSHAGLKKGIDDTRGTLFHDIASILEVKKPKFAVLENVKGLISHEKGHTLQVILRKITDMGYNCNISRDTIITGTTKEIQLEAKKMVMRSIDFGVPQNRQRIYIVLWRDNILDKFDYPEPLDIETKVGNILEKNVDAKYTISDRLWNGHKRRKIQNKINGKGFGFCLVNENSPYTNTISARYYKDGSEILIEQKGINPRKLTPREAGRVQGFPEEFQFSSSSTQAYKQFGNSVSVPVVGAIAQKIAHYLITECITC